MLVAFAPFLVTPLLMIGGGYLVFEATEKIIEKVVGDHHAEEELLEADTAEELEQRQVAGAIRTDFILSAEIMAIALAELAGNSIAMQGAALAAVAILITVAVYGVVALIVKLDDIGLPRRADQSGRPVGRPRPGPRRAQPAHRPVGHRHCGDAVGRRRNLCTGSRSCTSCPMPSTTLRMRSAR